MTSKDPSGGYTEFPFVAEFYDCTTPYQARQDVAFYLEMASTCDGSVLELGCGTGRVLLPIARAKKEIVGLDLSPPMLAVCREKLSRKAKEVQARVTLVQGDIQEFSLEQQFGLVTTPFRVFQHLLTVEDQLACLKCAWSHLVPGGQFILDVYNPYLPLLVDESHGEEHDEEQEFATSDGRTVVRSHRTPTRDYFNQINDEELIYYVKHPDGKEERLVHRFKMRYLFRFEAEHLLTRAGFNIE